MLSKPCQSCTIAPDLWVGDGMRAGYSTHSRTHRHRHLHRRRASGGEREASSRHYYEIRLFRGPGTSIITFWWTCGWTSSDVKYKRSANATRCVRSLGALLPPRTKPYLIRQYTPLSTMHKQRRQRQPRATTVSQGSRAPLYAVGRRPGRLGRVLVQQCVRASRRQYCCYLGHHLCHTCATLVRTAHFCVNFHVVPERGGDSTTPAKHAVAAHTNSAGLRDLQGVVCAFSQSRLTDARATCAARCAEPYDFLSQGW